MTIDDLNPRKRILTTEQKDKLIKLAIVGTNLETAMERTLIVTSGFRTALDQFGINPAVKKSAHMDCEAFDASDPDGEVYDWLINNLSYVVENNLYMEKKTYTPRWCHIQTRAVKSGNHFFIP